VERGKDEVKPALGKARLARRGGGKRQFKKLRWGRTCEASQEEGFRVMGEVRIFSQGGGREEGAMPRKKRL